jgi:hypothetical protein
MNLTTKQQSIQDKLNKRHQVRRERTAKSDWKYQRLTDLRAQRNHKL